MIALGAITNPAPAIAAFLKKARRLISVSFIIMNSFLMVFLKEVVLKPLSGLQSSTILKRFFQHIESCFSWVWHVSYLSL